MNDNEILELLHDFVRGRLTGEQAREIEARAAASATVRQELEKVRAYYGALEDMEPVRASDDFLDKVHERIEAESRPAGIIGKLFFPLRIKLPFELAGIAVSLLLIVFLYVPYMNREPSTRSEAPLTAQSALNDEMKTVNSPASVEKAPAAADDRLARADLAYQKERQPSVGAMKNETVRAAGLASGMARKVTKTKEAPVYKKELAAAPVVAPKPAASAFAPEQEAMTDAAAKKAVAPATPPPVVAIASSNYGQSPMVDKDRKKAETKTDDIAMAGPQAAPAPSAAMEYERMESAPASMKMSRTLKALEESSASSKELVVQWCFAPSEKNSSNKGALMEQTKVYDELEKRKETGAAASRGGSAPAGEISGTQNIFDATAKSERDAFVNGLIDKYNASVMGIDSGDVRIQHIFIASKSVPAFIKELKKHGSVSTTGKIPSKRSAESVTIILRTVQR
jgi:hypothetical protein